MDSRAQPPLTGFAVRLRDLRRRAGEPSLRELERLTRRTGRPYPRATIDDKLHGRTLPDWEFVAAFVEVCHRHAGWRGPPDLDGWRAEHRRVLTQLAGQGAGQRRATEAADALAGDDPLAVTVKLADVSYLIVRGPDGVLSTRSHITLVRSPSSETGPAPVHIPVTGHNVFLDLTAGPDSDITLDRLRAQVTRRESVTTDGVSPALPRQPDLVLSADLQEPARWAAAAFEPLEIPHYEVVLDADPAVVRTARDAPTDAHPGGCRTDRRWCPREERPAWSWRR
ncbi:hypothetical protein [Actinoplanes auranticolor]|uniref:Helix-turn-helix protein n=1 Tax=Actinoplanes auranticolor TaxID=47988 RepID=A0A919SCZ7_9ACTN|nr:hypothetical protein [Actinoplanes auranticolor]GIM69412.1 hypothetical protein Aau02nite_35900 [Actinoplanes auranticolor]